MIVEEEETIQPARRGDTVLHCCVDFSYDCYLLPLADADVDCRHDFKVLSQLQSARVCRKLPLDNAIGHLHLNIHVSGAICSEGSSERACLCTGDSSAWTLPWHDHLSHHELPPRNQTQYVATCISEKMDVFFQSRIPIIIRVRCGGVNLWGPCS